MNIRTSLWLALGTLALACTRDSVDLGGDTLSQHLERGARCSAATTVAENVVVSNQQELDALTGCEAITGNLIVRIFPDADLTPLASLRSVEGQLALGVEQDWDHPAAEPGAALPGRPRARGRCPEPGRDAEPGAGEPERHRRRLAAVGRAVQQPAAERSLGAGPVTTLSALILYETGVQELNALQNLELLDGPLTLFGNPALVDAGGLGTLQAADAVNIRDNATLEILPSFSNFIQQPSLVAITGNARLGRVELDFSQAATQVYDIEPLDGSGEGASFEVGPDVIDISNNAQHGSGAM